MSANLKDLVVITEQNAPFWEAIDRNQLTFQRCEACGHRWLPARRECPSCLSDKVRWQEACGAARLVSWVVYHSALHPAFEHRVPYNVAVVELKEGPRMISNVVGCPPDALRIDQTLRFVVREQDGVRIPQFEPDQHLSSSHQQGPHGTTE